MSRKPKTKTKNSPPPSSKFEVPEDEQWRLIRESGILKRASETPSFVETKSDQIIHAEAIEDDDEEWPLAEEIFAATTIAIPMSFLLLLMYM